MQQGDVIQISPTAKCSSLLQGLLAYVTEPKSWGCIAGVEVDGKGIAYVRLSTEDFHRIGAAEWVPDWVLE